MRVITNEEYEKEISNEAFVEQEHPRDSDGKFTSGGTHSSDSKPNSKAETAQKWQNKDISQKQKDRIDNHFKRNEEAIEKSDYKDILRKLSDNYPDMMEKISKRRSSTCTYDPKTQSFDDDRAGTEMLCGPSSTTIFLEGRIFDKGDVYVGYVKGDAYDNHRRKDEYENMGGKNYIGHVFIEMNDGTIVDGAYGQVYPKEVNINADMRLRIISPDDPDHDDYVKESRNYPFLNKSIELTKENDFGKNLPKSTIMNANMLGEAFVEQEHPRDEDGKFTDKDGSNSRVERQKSILQQEIDYLKKSIKEESKKYRPFEKVSDEDRSIRGKNRNVLENIKELEEELNSSDTVGLPHIPLKPNTHEIETIDNGMYLSNSDSEPEYESDRELMKTWSGMKLGLHSLEGFKKGNSTIKVSIDIKEKGSYGISRETAEKQINLAKIMWNSLSDEERDSINNFTIEQKPSVKMVKNEKGEDVIDGESLHDSSILGYWQPSTNELAIRIDSSYKSQEIKGTFIHEVAHSMYHKLKDKHPERIKEWKKSVEKIPPTTKYGKYNLKRWKNGEKQFKELEANNWEWQEVVAKDSDGNVIRTGKWNDEIKMEKELIPKEDVEKLKSTALSNIEFYKDLYFNEIHSEVHMYMMGQQKRGHMKKTGKVTKGISKFIDPYRLLHDLPKMEEPLVVGEVEEDSPVMEVVDITESISEVVIYLDENFERVLTEDEGEYEFIIELNDDMTIKKYTIKSMWEKVEEAFVEQEHPRAKDGKFAKKGTNSSGKSDLEDKLDSYIKDLEKKIEKQKESPSIQRILEKGGKPNEMDLKIAKLDDKMDKERDVETDRTFEHTWSDGETIEMTGTAKYEKLWKEYSELIDKQAKEEEEAYKEFYGWKEGDPIRWTPHNDDPDAGDPSGDYGPDYTYKHITNDETDSRMREQWNDMTREEREDRYRYFFSKQINYINEDGDTPEDLREDLGEDQSIPSEYFFFTDKKTRKQFRGFGMTEAEIKKRAEHGIGSYHEDNRLVGRPDRDVVVYDRPLDYAKFNSKHIPSKNFYNERNPHDEIKQSRKIDKLWDDMTEDERDTILSDEQHYGDYFIDWRSDQEKLFYEWKQKNDGFVNETVHDNLYSEYPDKSSATYSLEWTDEDYLKVGKKAWSKGSDKKLIELAKEYEQYGIMDDLKRELINKYQPKQYFQLDPNDRDEIAGDFFDSMNEYDKENILNNISDGRLDSSYTFSDLSEYEQYSVVKEIEGVDDETHYDIEEYFSRMQPKKAVAFDYERGIPKPQSINILKEWANRIKKFQYGQGLNYTNPKKSEKSIRSAIIPTYPKVEQRSVEEHEEKVKELNSNLKEEMGDGTELDVERENEEFIEYVRSQEPNINLDLDIYKVTRERESDSTRLPKTEKKWREEYVNKATSIMGDRVTAKIEQLSYLADIIESNPELQEKYQSILDKTEKLNHENFDLFLKTPEFYRGTNTDELDHYIENNNLGKEGDWDTKQYHFTSMGMDKSGSYSPSEFGIDRYGDRKPLVRWRMGNDGVVYGGKTLVTYEGDSVRNKALPVQYNTQSKINSGGIDISEVIGMPYNMQAYNEREVRINGNDSIPKIKEISFQVNYGSGVHGYNQKTISKEQRKKLVKKYKSLVGGDVSKIKFYKYVKKDDESYIAQEFVEQEHPRDNDGKFSKKGQKSGKKTLAQRRKEYDEQAKFMDKKPEKLTSEQQYEQLLDAFGGDRKELVGKSWLLPTGQVIQPDRARDDGGKYAWHDNWIKSTGCDDCIKIRADTTREFDPKGELAHLHISGLNSTVRKEGISEKQLDMVIEFIEKWKLDSDDVQIDDDSYGSRSVIREQINGRLSGFSRNRSEFAQRIAQRNKMGEAFKEEEHPRDGDGKFTDKGGSSEKTYESGEKVAEYKKEIKEEITPTKEENEKNSQVEKSVIDGIRERIKGTNYEDKIKFIETQGSFAKGTDLAGSSDLDIFVGFDYDIDIKEIEEVILELGDDVLKPISDEGEYKIMNGAGKKYPESYVNGVEVQIIGTSDITLEQIKKGFEEGGMKTATDRSPHHTRFMKKALKGKEQEVRTLKKFFKNAGVYDASIAKQGFSGFSTEVLIHNLGSFDKVLEFFANFEKGSVVGETSRKFDTPLVMVDPIDENRNLASAFSHSDKEGSIIPNKNLARLIKSAQSIIETGELPEITKEKEDSISIDLEVPENLDKNEVYSQAYSSAMDLQTVFKMNGYGVMVPIDKITDDFEVKVPRINVEYDGKKNVKINFGLKNFENEYEYKSKMKNDRPKEQIDAFMERNDDVVEIDGTYYARVKRVFNTAEKFLHGVVDGKVKNVGLGVVGRLENNEWVNKWKTKNISRGEKEYENITGKIKSTESYVVITEAEFKEEEHPREDNGKFAKKGSGSSSQKTELQKLDDGIGTTKDFINQWSGWNRTAIYDNLIDKGGLSSATWKTNTDVRVGDRLSVGIIDVDSEEDWDNAKDMFLQALEDNPKFKKVFKKYEKEVKQQNKALQKRYGEEKTFYRGGTVDELEAIFGEYEDKYYNPEWRSRYNFKSLSMNYIDTLKMYNGGMMIHFNGDSVRESQSKLVNYKAEPTKYLHANVDSSIDQEEIENIDTDNPAFLLDEEEVRVNNENMNNVKIDKIEIFMRSAGFGHTSHLLHKKLGIDYYGDKRNELDGLVNNWYNGKWDENGGKYFNVVDGKIVDKKTNKVYEKTNEGLKKGEKEMKLEIQNALMKNKKFREKVKEVVIK